MKVDKMNNIVVLKGMKSNIVEEAIVVLKPNINFKPYQNASTKKVSSKNKSQVLIKEAENVINDYIHHIQKEDKLKIVEKIEKRYKKMKMINILLVILSIVLILKII